MKTEFKGTKGRWEFDACNMKIKGTGDFEGRTIIANVSPRMDYSRGMTTQSANAKLISCAPDMLEMLELLTTVYSADNIEKAKLLIKKATTI